MAFSNEDYVVPALRVSQSTLMLICFPEEYRDHIEKADEPCWEIRKEELIQNRQSDLEYLLST